MKPQLAIALITTLLLPAVAMGAQDASEGTVLALDRKANTMVLTDRSVWALEAMKAELPAGLKAGDRVHIDYQSDEEGVSAIIDIRILPPKKASAKASDVSTGTVLVFDRKANILVLTDRTVWALEVMKGSIPAGLKAGDRVEIQYESDEEGISAIDSIEIVAN